MTELTLAVFIWEIVAAQLACLVEEAVYSVWSVWRL
jgi:hypothetical protein